MVEGKLKEDGRTVYVHRCKLCDSLYTVKTRGRHPVMCRTCAMKILAKVRDKEWTDEIRMREM